MEGQAMTDPILDDDSSLTRSLLVDRLAEAGQTAIRTYSRARGDADVPAWADLDQTGRNRVRALIVALVDAQRADLDALLAQLSPSTAHPTGPARP
jgi:hypothetical protein